MSVIETQEIQEIIEKEKGLEVINYRITRIIISFTSIRKEKNI